MFILFSCFPSSSLNKYFKPYRINEQWKKRKNVFQIPNVTWYELLKISMLTQTRMVNSEGKHLRTQHIKVVGSYSYNSLHCSMLPGESYALADNVGWNIIHYLKKFVCVLVYNLSSILRKWIVDKMPEFLCASGKIWKTLLLSTSSHSASILQLNNLK